MIRTHLLLPLAYLAALASCKVGPEYDGPPEVSELELPGAFGEIEDPAFQSGEADLRNWWLTFEDEQLTRLIERAATDNRDLRIALSRVNEARARTGIARSNGAPQVGINADAGQVNDMTTGFESRTRSNAGVGASWELDVFGRIARQVEAANAEFQATEEDMHDVQVALYAEVARSYLSVRAYQAQLSATQDSIVSQGEILKLTLTRLENGLSSGLDVAQARQVLAVSEAAVPPLRIALSRSINTIAVLIGTHPQAIHEDLATPRPIPVPPATITVDVPVQILRQRPDVRAAERRLAAQSAQVGVATADLYPSFSLDGSFGFSSLDGSSLLDAGSQAFSLGPSFRWNLFDGGRVRSQIDMENAKLEQLVLLYESAILSAMEEVETSMTAFTEQRLRVDAIERAAEASREMLRLASILYRDGHIQFQDVLDSQRQVFHTESQVAEARGLASQNLVVLYKALGGGWDPSAAADD